MSQLRFVIRPYTQGILFFNIICPTLLQTNEIKREARNTRMSRIFRSSTGGIATNGRLIHVSLCFEVYMWQSVVELHSIQLGHMPKLEFGTPMQLGAQLFLWPTCSQQHALIFLSSMIHPIIIEEPESMEPFARKWSCEFVSYDDSG